HRLLGGVVVVAVQRGGEPVRVERAAAGAGPARLARDLRLRAERERELLAGVRDCADPPAGRQDGLQPDVVRGVDGATERRGDGATERRGDGATGRPTAGVTGRTASRLLTPGGDGPDASGSEPNPLSHNAMLNEARWHTPCLRTPQPLTGSSRCVPACWCSA